MSPVSTPGESPLNTLIEDLTTELEQAEREQRETTRMVQQSRNEVDKLTQRNATLASQIKQMQNNLESLPRNTIKQTFEAAQEAQQRLFTVRAQAEKMQSDQANLERRADLLRATLEKLQACAPAGKSTGSSLSSDDKPVIVRVVEAQEAERLRLSRQIHDGPAQALSNFILQTDIAMRLFDRDPERAKSELSSLKVAAKSAFDGIRDFIFDLRPMMLDDLGLVPTVKRYLDSYREKSGLQVSLNITGAERRLESVCEVMLFRGLQELLGNIRNHAQATQVRISLDTDDSRVRVVVEDNGKGFDLDPVLQERQKNVGLSTLRERLESLGGQLEIDSQIGQGTRVIMEVPIGE